jgi:antitoxin component of RelBE/YafQ-DinJ toxin-antitoxin module
MAKKISKDVSLLEGAKKSGQKVRTINVRLDEDQYIKLEKICEDQSITVSEAVRVLVKKLVDEES